MTMLCPICTENRLRKDSDGFLDCPRCGLRRRANDKICANEKSNFLILNRNVRKTSAGSEVEMFTANSSFLGADQGESVTIGLRSKTGLVIATSRDRDDLIILIAECDWRIQDPEIAAAVDHIRDD